MQSWTGNEWNSLFSCITAVGVAVCSMIGGWLVYRQKVMEDNQKTAANAQKELDTKVELARIAAEVAKTEAEHTRRENRELALKQDRRQRKLAKVNAAQTVTLNEVKTNTNGLTERLVKQAEETGRSAGKAEAKEHAIEIAKEVAKEVAMVAVAQPVVITNPEPLKVEVTEGHQS